MRRVLLYGTLLAAAALVLTWLDFQQVARAYPFQIYAALVGALFLVAGVVVGAKLGITKAPPPFDGNPQARATLGRSTAEIAEHRHISQSTVKTHVARLFQKLDARSRRSSSRSNVAAIGSWAALFAFGPLSRSASVLASLRACSTSLPGKRRLP